MGLALSELCRRVGDEYIKIQNLGESLAGARSHKNGVTEVSFFTQEVSPATFVGGDEKVIGLILWLPRDRVEKAQAEWEVEQVRAPHGEQP